MIISANLNMQCVQMADQDKTHSDNKETKMREYSLTLHIDGEKWNAKSDINIGFITNCCADGS